MRCRPVGGAPGVKVAAHIPGRPVDPMDGPFTEIDPALEAEAADYVRDRLPGLEPAGLAAETCLYTMTADEDFVLDRACYWWLAAAAPGMPSSSGRCSASSWPTSPSARTSRSPGSGSRCGARPWPRPDHGRPPRWSSMSHRRHSGVIAATTIGRRPRLTSLFSWRMIVVITSS